MPNVLLKLPPGLGKAIGDRLGPDAVPASSDAGVHVEPWSDDAAPGTLASAEERLAAEHLFAFVVDGVRYPAALVNMPTLVEALKTFNGTSYFKSGDIGQALIVYETEEERAEDLRRCPSEEPNQRKNSATALASAAGASVPGYTKAPPAESEEEEKARVRGERMERRYYHSGITPPMGDIVQRRFVNTERWKAKNIPKAEVEAVCRELEDYLPPPSARRRKDPAKEIACEAYHERVVDVADYMLDPSGGSERVWNLDDLLKKHPEFAKLLLDEKDREELEANAPSARASPVNVLPSIRSSDSAAQLLSSQLSSQSLEKEDAGAISLALEDDEDAVMGLDFDALERDDVLINQ